MSTVEEPHKFAVLFNPAASSYLSDIRAKGVLERHLQIRTAVALDAMAEPENTVTILRLDRAHHGRILYEFSLSNDAFAKALTAAGEPKQVAEEMRKAIHGSMAKTTSIWAANNCGIIYVSKLIPQSR